MALNSSFTKVATVALLLIVAACGNGDSGDGEDPYDPEPSPTPTPTPLPPPPPAPQCGNNRCEVGEGISVCATDCVPGGGDAVPASYTVSLQVYPNASVATVVNRDRETIYCSGRIYGYYPNGAFEMFYWRGHNAVVVGGVLDVPVYSSPVVPFVNGQHTITCRKPAE